MINIEETGCGVKLPFDAPGRIGTMLATLYALRTHPTTYAILDASNLWA